jgi:hypothetical protein
LSVALAHRHGGSGGHGASDLAAMLLRAMSFALRPPADRLSSIDDMYFFTKRTDN